VLNGHSGSSKVIDFGTNWKWVCSFLLVINSNLGPVLPRFRDIASFLMRTATLSIFVPNFGAVPIELDCVVGAPRSEDPRLVILINYFWSNPTYMTTVPQRQRQTNGWMDACVVSPFCHCQHSTGSRWHLRLQQFVIAVWGLVAWMDRVVLTVCPHSSRARNGSLFVSYALIMICFAASPS